MEKKKGVTKSGRDFRTKQGEDMPLGISGQGDYVRFTVALPGETSCTLVLYQHGEEVPAAEFSMPEVSKGIFSIEVALPVFGTQKNPEYDYVYRTCGRVICDPYAVQIYGREVFGEGSGELRARVYLPEKRSFDYVRHPMEELILYKLHVRGFTKSKTSGVKHPGTYRGLAEKIPYLKELGINAVLLLPVVEFNECMEEQQKERETIIGVPTYRYTGQAKETDAGAAPTGKQTKLHSETGKLNSETGKLNSETGKLNFWGYQCTNTFYLAPKASYAAKPALACEEFADMVDALHAAGVDVYLEMMFDESCTQLQMLHALRHWVRFYGIDGFHINDAELSPTLIAEDVYLQDTVVFAASVSEKHRLIYPGRFAQYRDDFRTKMRCYLKGDEGLVPELFRQFKECRSGAPAVHYITDHNGFTLRDLYSYDVRHNEDNMENGRDGAVDNYSWNCGEEGPTRKRKIEALRLRMMKNALTLLFLSRGVPMLLAGDEFARTKQGNNNSYCQDNAVSWLDWSLLKKYGELFQYTKRLILLRQTHPVFYLEREPGETDYLACGYPEISLHGRRPWQTDSSAYNRLAGIMLCGSYIRTAERTFEPDVYLLFNMHWETHVFELPMPEGTEWEMVCYTASLQEQKPIDEGRLCTLLPRSIVVLFGRKDKR